MRLCLRRATLEDVAVLEQWDADPDVIAATSDDESTERAFGGLDWREELSLDSEVSYHLIAEVDGRPVGAMQICDPHVEPTHYWGDISPNLRAVDIWIGAERDRNKGYGREMMRRAHDRCFADPDVTAIVIDPLASNTRAIAFYHRLGYVTVEPRCFGDDDCLVLTLTRDAWLETAERSGR
ncbi:MAG: GNAT family N-acetyltransferase [Vicinamibacterales bacterium]